jgi:hypothetical protein
MWSAFCSDDSDRPFHVTVTRPCNVADEILRHRLARWQHRLRQVQPPPAHEEATLCPSGTRCQHGTEAHDHGDTPKSIHCVLLACREVRIGRRPRHVMTFRENADDSRFAVLYGVQIGGVCTAFSKSKARATPDLDPGPLGLGPFHQGLTCTRRGWRDAVGFEAWGAGDENRRQVPAGCQYGWCGRPSHSMEENRVLEMKFHCRESSSRCHNRS